MDVTRRFWVVASVGVSLAVLTPVFGQPQLLYGAAGIGALLLYRQLRFLRAVRTIHRSVSVDQSVTDRHVNKGEETYLTFEVRTRRPTSLPLTVAANPPLFADGPSADERTVHLDSGERSATGTIALRWPVVGRGTIAPVTVTVEDPLGLFRSTFTRGSTPTVTVEPRVPRNVHVGEGGDQVAAAFGGHRSDQHGEGIDPAELRQYVPGDSVSNIDWKATARLDYPHVREYEVETDQQMVLFVDHRGSMATGAHGQRKLDYLREVALTIVKNASDANDPTGVAGIGAEGPTTFEKPATGGEAYETVRATLHDLEPDGDAGADREGRTRARASELTQGVADARRKATLLAGDGTAYEQRLRPFFDEGEGYLQRMTDDPLFQTVRTRLKQVAGESWVLLFTDDTDRAELRETAKLAVQEAGGVVVFITPTVLFERDGLADLDAAYEEYVDFEEFRRELARIDGIRALEVGPGDRVAAVLDAGRRR